MFERVAPEHLESLGPGPVPALCRLAGLGDDGCDCCPWPACVLDVPASGPNAALRWHLDTCVRRWLKVTVGLPCEVRRSWLRVRVRQWMYGEALAFCEAMHEEEAGRFLAIMGVKE